MVHMTRTARAWSLHSRARARTHAHSSPSSHETAPAFIHQRSYTVVESHSDSHSSTLYFYDSKLAWHFGAMFSTQNIVVNKLVYHLITLMNEKNNKKCRSYIVSLQIPRTIKDILPIHKQNIPCNYQSLISSAPHSSTRRDNVRQPLSRRHTNSALTL